MSPRRWMRLLAPGLVGVAVLVLSGCGSAPATATQAVRDLALGIPAGPQSKPLATGVEESTPDGGFYYDKSYLRFYYMRRVGLDDVLPLLSGSELTDARSLEGLGKLVEVVALASNPGASTNSVQLTQAVLESRKTSELVPGGVRTALQKTYYNPIRPIVVLSSDRLDECSASENPGAAVWLVAVFPPVSEGVRIAVVQPGFGSYIPLNRGRTPWKVPTSMYSQDVDGCLQILSQSN